MKNNMGEGKVENRQYAFKIARVSVLKTTTKEVQEVAQREADKAQKIREADLQKKYEAASQLSQDEVKMELLKKIQRGRTRLSFENVELLSLAEKRLAGRLIFGPSGWKELTEEPKEDEQEQLRGEAVPHAGNRVVEGVVEAV